MILDCPKCNARFIVADHLIPVAGRTVKCGSCANNWHVSRPAPVEAPPPPPPEPAIEAPTEDSFAALLQPPSVPAIQKRTLPTLPFKIAVPVLAFVWFALGMVSYYPKWLDLPGLSSLYGLFGVTSTEGLVFSDVHMQREVVGAKTRFVLSGSVVNHAAIGRRVPAVYVSLKDRDNKDIWGRTYEVNVNLKPSEVYPFRIVNVETARADQVATIILDVGHPLALMMR